MLANSFYNIKRDIKNLAEKNRILISKDIEYAISSWLEERINNIETSSKFFGYNQVYKKEEHIKNLLNILLNNNLYFDTVQTLVEGYYFYGDKRLYHDYKKDPNFISKEFNIEPLKTEWYIKTKTELKTTITTMKIHGELHEKTINICTPIIYEEKFQGVLCGVIKTESIFNKIQKLKLNNKTYYFISDRKGKILTTLKDEKLKNDVEKSFLKGKIKDVDGKQEIKIDNDSITIENFKHFNWYIGVGMKDKDISELGFAQLVENVAFLSFCFFALLILVNASHEFLRRRTAKAEREYEYILGRRSRMQEIGELISGINHQLYQPLNSLTLLLTTTKSKLNDKTLDDATLDSNLSMCVKASQLMAKTINSFKNFYRCNEDIKPFFLYQSIEGLLHILHVDLSRKNIRVEFDIEQIKELKVNSVENFIQQILLVLLQNSKDALDEKLIKKRVIKIEVEEREDMVFIKIIDWGGGISNQDIKKLFSDHEGKSKKNLGSGIGLFFAKKLAQEKLKGDIILEKNYNPTVFTFNFKKDLERDNDE
ncbi:sensor histidine kinase [Halarcobacter ebronensis]|nr:sensor histidine kinase [Halarcobacter ebronensis]